MVAYKYVVHSDVDENNIYNEFDTASEAVEYAREHKDSQTYVDKVEVELNDFGEVTQEYGSERIWSFADADEEDEMVQHMIQQHEDELWVDPYEADEFGDAYTNRHESFDADKIVEDMEENESEVECKHCFDLFPKDECVKTEHGYLCKECAKVKESLEDTVEQDLNDDRTPVQEVEEILAEPFNASEMRKHEHAIKEEFGYENLFDYTGEVMEEVENNSDLYEFWWEDADDDLAEDAPGVHEINYVDYKHSYCHALQPKLRALNYLVNVKKVPVDNIKGFIFNLLKDSQVRWTEKEKEFAKNIQAKDDARDIYNYVVNSINKAKDIIVKVNENGELVGSYRTEECLPEELEEYFNYPSIEIDDTELDGMDNAVVDCQTDFKVIAHSEDEKPLDCKMKKAPLEEPLAGKKVKININESDEENLANFKAGVADLLKNNPDYGTAFRYEVWGRDGNKGILLKASDDISEESFENLRTWMLENGGLFLFDLFGANKDKAALCAWNTEELSKIPGQEILFDDKYEFALQNSPIGGFVEIDEDDIKTNENLEEAKKEDELPPDPEAAKLEVHTMLNNLVADEIEAINGYEEAKAEIMDAPIAHKDVILDTVDHVEDEEKEHVDELIDATTEIPFDGEHKEEAPIKEEPVKEPVEEPVNDDPFDQDFPEVEEPTEAEEDSEAKVEESYPDIPFDSEVKEGDKIRIIHLSGENSDYDGKEGVVEHIDGIGQLHGTWGGLAVIPGVDEFEIIK